MQFESDSTQVVDLHEMVSKKVAKKAVAAKKGGKAKRTYNTYIHRILKQVSPGTRISKRAMATVNNFVTDTFDKIAVEASKLCRNAKKQTMQGRDVDAAAKLVLQGELAKHATAEGAKALAKCKQ